MIAQTAINAGDFDTAVLQARKAISLLEESVRSAFEADLATVLMDRLDERHAKLYVGLIKRGKDMGNINNANHTFKFHARPAITMYAQLLSNVSTGVRSACTPFFNCSMRFSWLQRSFAPKTISSAEVFPSFVM